MKFAYLILCHKNAAQVRRLIDRLNEAQVVFVLHVSKTCEQGFLSEIQNELSTYSNVHYCPREDGMHNSFGVIKAILNGFSYLRQKGIEYDYIHLLSGQDYPVKSRQEIRRYFEKNNGKQFLEFFPLYAQQENELTPEHPWGAHRQLYRINRYHLKIDGAIRSIPELETSRLIDKSLFDTLKIFGYESRNYLRQKTFWRELQLLLLSRLLPHRRSIPKDMELYGGKTWWSLTHEAVDYIENTIAKDRRYVQFFKYTLIPDEMFFQTVLMNSTWKETCINQSLRFIRWEKEDGLHPVFISAKYLREMMEQPEYLFARKFDPEINQPLMDEIDRIKHRHD